MKPTSSKPIVNSFLIFGLALGLTSGQAEAWETGSVMVAGLANKSCSNMTDDIKNTEDGEKIYKIYLQGFVSGVNSTAYGEADFVEGTDLEGRYKFILKYCEDNQLDSVYQAIFKVPIKCFVLWV